MTVEPIRILLFSTLFPHVGEPTLGVFVENRLRYLLKDEAVEAVVVAPVPWFPFKNKLWGAYGRAAKAQKIEKRNGITVYHPRYLVIPKVGMLITPFFLFLSAWKCMKSLQKQGFKFDLIDAHYLYPDAVAAKWLARKAGIPFCATARGSDVTQIGLMALPKKYILSMSKAATHIITVSENLRQDLIAMGRGENKINENKITTLRNGVNLDFFKTTDRENTRKNWKANGPIMLFAGWLIPRKRLDLVLAVTKEIPSIKTVIVGDGPLKGELEKQVIDDGLADRVLFVGQKKPTDMPAMYSAADVLLLPSDREGWANVLLESMACGTPVVTRNVGGAPDLITDDKVGQVIDTDDPKAIAEGVIDVLTRATDRPYVRKFAEGFDWEETSRGQKNIFDQMLNASATKKDVVNE